MNQFDLDSLIRIAPEIASLMEHSLTEGSIVTWLETPTQVGMLLPKDTTRDGNLRRIHLFGDNGEYLGEVGVVKGFFMNKHISGETLGATIKRLRGNHADVHIVDVQSYYNPPAINIVPASLYD